MLACLAFGLGVVLGVWFAWSVFEAREARRDRLQEADRIFHDPGELVPGDRWYDDDLTIQIWP